MQARTTASSTRDYRNHPGYSTLIRTAQPGTATQLSRLRSIPPAQHRRRLPSHHTRQLLRLFDDARQLRCPKRRYPSGAMVAGRSLLSPTVFGYGSRLNNLRVRNADPQQHHRQLPQRKCHPRPRRHLSPGPVATVRCLRSPSLCGRTRNRRSKSLA